MLYYKHGIAGSESDAVFCSMIKIGIVEDDPGIRESIAEFVNLQSDMACLVAASTADAVLTDLEQYQDLDLLLLDINLPGTSGLEAIIPLKKGLPGLEIIMLTIHNSAEAVFGALCAGATGYLIKSTSLCDIAKAIRTQMQGGSAMSPSIARKVVSRFSTSPSPLVEGHAHRNHLDHLTPKEQQVLQALADGLSYKLVAARLDMSPNTVPVHIRNIYKKLQINSKAEAIAIFLKQLK